MTTETPCTGCGRSVLIYPPEDGNAATCGRCAGVPIAVPIDPPNPGVKVTAPVDKQADGTRSYGGERGEPFRRTDVAASARKTGRGWQHPRPGPPTRATTEGQPMTTPPVYDAEGAAAGVLRLMLAGDREGALHVLQDADPMTALILAEAAARYGVALHGNAAAFDEVLEKWATGAAG